jgi:large subunit ribosomal protein L25
MTEEIIQVAKRDAIGKAASRSLRKQGLIPAVIYGLNEPPTPVAISPKIVARIIASETGLNSMIHFQREGTDIKRHVIIKDVQRDPVTGRLSHVDFMRVDPTHKVRVKVPIHLHGTPLGVKEGGLLDFTHREVEVECLPSFIPAHVDASVDHLDVGDALRLDDLKLDPRLTIVGDPHNVICSVKGKQAEEELPEAAPAEGAEAAPAEGAAAEGAAAEAAPAKGRKEKDK